MSDDIRKLLFLIGRRDRIKIAFLFAMMLGGALFEVVGVGAIPVFVAMATAPERLLEYDLIREFYVWRELENPQQLLLWAAVILISIYVVKNVYVGVLSYLQARISMNMLVRTSSRLFSAYLYSPYTFQLQRNTAELLRNTNHEVGAAITGVLVPLLNVAMDLLILSFLLVLLVVNEPLISLCIGLVFGGTVFAFYRLTRKRINAAAEVEQEHRGLSVKVVNQGLGGIKDVKVLGREPFFLRAYATSSIQMGQAGQLRSVLNATPRLFLETFAVAGVLGAVSIFLWQGRSLETIIPSLTLLTVAVVRPMPSFQRISANVSCLQWGTRSLDVVYHDLLELEASGTSERQESNDKRFGVRGALKLEDVSYTYPGASIPSLCDISITIPRGSAVGFVGPSGAGKTTIVDIILGLLEPQSGRVLVDGVDIRDNMGAWQRQIGYIPQHIYLTDDTVRRNVAFGLDDEEIDDDAVWRALEAAHLRGLVESLPHGLDTMVGELGSRLSGGQRQRIGIARALYHDPVVLVMDEATSALDNQTERYVVEALEHLRGDRTLIIIAHRLSTVRDCDILYFLESGRLCASGRFEELLHANESFAIMAA